MRYGQSPAARHSLQPATVRNARFVISALFSPVSSSFLVPTQEVTTAFVSVFFFNLHYSYGKLRNWSDDFLETCTD